MCAGASGQCVFYFLQYNYPSKENYTAATTAPALNMYAKHSFLASSEVSKIKAFNSRLFAYSLIFHFYAARSGPSNGSILSLK
jgi:hypothetical protein